MRNKAAELYAWQPTWDYALEHALWVRQNEGWKPRIVRTDNGNGWWLERPVYGNPAT